MTWEYIAGFFDGEGSITHNKKGYRITISQTDLKVLQKIRNYVDYGFVFKNKKRKSHWKDSWIYYIAKQESVLEFLIKIKPLAVVKKEQIIFIIPILKKAVKNINKKKRIRLANIVKAKKLREQGLTYRQIGKKLNIDFGHARRLALGIYGDSSSIG
ncbi:LAGLIDADG family homing endonuclease [Patescibacteria group bacterium]|nr:hypothetical protein [Candidatus Falkowbacteria bacterium]MBU3905600.1 LAGLIDADG family homing endonuclease [Patescibacteria group bacterium]MBU4015793.1 LAGLIDADG family homing endonuclease [Patescibacteria group bacterium]MBU4026285.1 LAGLIDADG family homing endonuclease [Patescibacteria group bacterium]MBU4073071.1 LAGLIDADG family homing endonuclease [Patescibacteria group bacterium]